MILYNFITRVSDCLKCKSGYIWCTDGKFISPSDFKDSGKKAYGYALDDHVVVPIRRSEHVMLGSEAELYCTNTSNAGRYGYLPDRIELTTLQRLIMGGRMMHDLLKASLYEDCNYRNNSILEDNDSWGLVWCSCYNEEGNEKIIGLVSFSCLFSKWSPSGSRHYVIPFYKF